MLLALFPLQLALFPGEEVPLHIFEPRYKQLIVDCRDGGITFGIPTHVSGQVSKVGTEVSLVRILHTYDNGEMDILVRGIRVFKIDELQQEIPGKLYSGARVTIFENDAPADPVTQRDLLERYAKVMNLLRKDAVMPEDGQVNPSFFVARHLAMTLPQRLSLLAMDKEPDRQDYLVRHLKRVAQTIRQKRNGGAVVGSNGKSTRAGD